MTKKGGSRYENDEQYRSFVENANDIIYTLSPEGIFGFVSEKWQESLGHEISDVMGRSFEPFVHPDDVKICMDFLNTIVQTGEKQQGVEYRVKHKDGTWRWHTSNASPLKNERGEVIKFLGIARDITRRKEAEEETKKFKTIADKAVHGSAVASLSGNLEYVNQYFANVHGYSPAQLIGKHLSVFHNNDQMRTVENLNAMLFKEGGFESKEIWHSRRDGSVFPMQMSGVLVKDEKNNPLYISVTAIDVTENIKNQETIKLRLSYEEAVSKVSALLLAKPGKEDVYEKTLKIIQKTTRANRVYMFENFTDPVDGLCMKQTHEVTWNAIAQIDNPALQYVVYKKGFKRWKQVLQTGKQIVGAVRNFPKSEQEILMSQQIKSILIIPVFLDGKWVGFIGFDDTQTERIWSEEDVSLLFAIGDMIGNYMYREQNILKL